MNSRDRKDDYDMSVNVRDLIDQGSHSSSKAQKRKVLTTNAIDSKVAKIKDMLVKLSQEIKDAKTHIRGTKARHSVENAMSIVTKLLKLTNTTPSGLTRKTAKSKNVCMEVYKGTTYGYPFFYKGFEIENCSYAIPIENLVTVVVLHKSGDNSSIPFILKRIKTYNKDINIVVGTTNAETEKVYPTTYEKVQFKNIPTNYSDGKAWNLLFEQVNTQYTLVARDISYFNIDARLERLVREIESLNVSVAGGASRDKNGFWSLGCYQRAFKNFSLVYEYGYDESLHECIFCDYINAPFLIRTKTLNNVKFDDKMKSSSAFHDFFIRLSRNKLESVVCPDSMFYVNKEKTSSNSKTWLDLANKYNLYQLKIADEVDIIFNCTKKRGWPKSLGYAVHPCSLQELADMVKFVMKLCEDSGIICELQEGTLLGAVKLHKVLPWERDADLTFLTSNFSAFVNLKQQIAKKYGISSDQSSIWCCADNRTAGGKAKVYSTNWHIELYGQHQMDSEMLLVEGFKPTKVLLDGQWVWVPRNPGWHARNRYGREIYAHAQHWMAMGKGDGWINYKTNEFTPCKTPGSEDCLDNFNADGNLQFSIPIP